MYRLDAILWCVRRMCQIIITSDGHSVPYENLNCCSFGSENGLCPELKTKSNLKQLLCDPSTHK